MDDELKELRYADGTRERLVLAAELTARADAAGVVEAASQAKAIETRIARELGQHQHAVVACAELIERWPQLAARGGISNDTKRMIVWGLKYGAGSAMDLPEIPLATVEEVIAHLERVLAHVGRKPWAAWELDARRAFIAGDEGRLRERVAAIGPTIGRTSHAWQDSDCPGCTLLAFADYLGRDARPEEVEAVLEPVISPSGLSGASFPADSPETREVFDLLYGDDPICENARASTPVKLARAYARHGRVAEARIEAERGLEYAGGREPERLLRAQVAALEVAVVRRALGEIVSLAKAARPIAARLEDAYERLDADLVLHAAIALVDDAGLHAELPGLAEDARVIARRLDARLSRPRHVEATERALQGSATTAT